VRHLAWLGCFVLVFVSAFFLSGTRHPPLELDPSWNVVLEYATSHHWQFGTEIIFTFGPLGFLAATTSLGHLLVVRVAFAFFWSALVALTATKLANRLPGWVRYAFLAWLVVFTLSEGLDQTAFWILASGGLFLLIDNSPQRRWQAPVYVFAFIVLALVKASFFTAGFVSLTLVTVCWARQRKFKSAMVLMLAAPAGFIICWMVCGQSISHLMPWIRHGMELESGYSGAMNLVPKTPVLCAALAGLALLAGALIAMMVRVQRDFTSWAVVLTLAQYGFLAWKEGFTRSGDWHVFVFLWFLPLGMAFFLLEGMPGSPAASWRWILNLAFVASMVLALVGAHFQISGFAWRQVTAWPRRFVGNSRAIVATLGGHANSLYADCRDPRNFQMLLLERAQDVIGNESVDVMNYLQLAALINNMNYQPRPVFQGFVAYTPALQRLNEEYFQSSQRPRFVMLYQQATDGRFPALEDSAVLNYILNNYVPVARDGRFLILHQQTAEDTELRLVHDQTVHFGEALDLRPWMNGPLFMSVEITPSLLGRVATILYQQHPLYLRVSRNQGEEQYRVVPSMAERPFLISPLLNTNFDVMNLYTAQSGKKLESVTFEPSGYASFEFHNTLRVRLYSARAFPHAANNVSAARMLADVQGRVFWPLPTSVASATPARVTIFHGTSALMVRAPSKIVLEIPQHALSFSGYFGVPEEGANEDAKAQGVAVSIEVQDQSGQTRRRLDRILKASSNPNDRGRFSFHLPIQSPLDRTIKLSTSFVSAGRDEGNLSFWSQCRFEERDAGRAGP
jgi:hypothetical protein